MKKRIFAILLTLCMLLGLLPAGALADDLVTSGYCGENGGKNIAWAYDAGTKTLTISGTGAMPDNEADNTVYYWTGYEWWNNVENIIIKDGITHIGAYAFWQLWNVKNVSIADSVVSIGQFAFGGDEDLVGIAWYKNLLSKGGHVIVNGILLHAEVKDGVLNIPDTVTSVAGGAISGAESVTFPKSVKRISAFACCGEELKEITVLNPNCVFETSNCSSVYGVNLSEVETTAIGTWCRYGGDNPLCMFIEQNVTVYGYENSTAQAYCEAVNSRKWYIRSSDGGEYNEEVKNANWKFVELTTPPAKEGWEQSDGAWYYYENDNPVIGWQQVDGTWYYFNGSGVMQTGWVSVDGVWYYMNGSGAMQTGWLNDGGTWYYLYDSGAMATGWLNDGAWYYLTGSGTMSTGWVSVDGTWYYMNSSGAMQTGWLNDGGTWYYLYDSGAMATGWLNDGAWYYLNGSGSMATGWVSVDGVWYYMNSSGVMQTGWVDDGGTWYYLDSNGAWTE